MLKGKNAVITGCNRGIGLSVLKSFAMNGADIFACARSETPAFTETVNRLSEEYSVDICPLYFDVTDDEGMKAAVAKVQSSKKPVDILVNNAGISYNALFQMSAAGKLKEVFETNFFSVFQFTQYISKIMLRQKSGSIINISSSTGIDANVGRSVYGASKAAVIYMTKVIAAELGGYGIRANSIAPGVIDTDLLSDMTEEVVKKALGTTTLKRIGKPSEIAAVAVFLASDLSSYITGQVIRVDGGIR
jgi:3-oxoacyl-[acyl-carrier protein] reductase